MTNLTLLNLFYHRKDLRATLSTGPTCDSISPHDLLWRTRDLMDQLKIAIDPVQEIWTKTMDAPEMDLSGLSNGQTIMRVNYRPEDWLLLSESIQLQSKAINFIFEKQQVSPN